MLLARTNFTMDFAIKMGNIDALITKAEVTIDFGDVRNGIQAIRDASNVLHAIKNSGYFKIMNSVE